MHIWTYHTKTSRSRYDINDRIGCWNIWKLGMWGLRVGQSPRDDRASHRQQQLNYFCWFLRLSISIKFFLRDCGCPCLPTLIVQNFHPLNIGLQTKIPSSIQAGTYNIHSPLLDNTQRTSTRVYRSLAATYLHLTLTAQVLGVMKSFMMFLCLKEASTPQVLSFLNKAANTFIGRLQRCNCRWSPTKDKQWQLPGGGEVESLHYGLRPIDRGI